MWTLGEGPWWELWTKVSDENFGRGFLMKTSDEDPWWELWMKVADENLGRRSLMRTLDECPWWELWTKVPPNHNYKQIYKPMKES